VEAVDVVARLRLAAFADAARDVEGLREKRGQLVRSDARDLATDVREGATLATLGARRGLEARRGLAAS
jgi:hypothetical protein